LKRVTVPLHRNARDCNTVTESLDGHHSRSGTRWRERKRRGVIPVQVEVSRRVREPRWPARERARKESLDGLERERMRAADATPTPAPPFFILRDLDGCWLNASVSEAIYDEFRNPDPEEVQFVIRMVCRVVAL
jgi:hypothetical protein